MRICDQFFANKICVFKYSKKILKYLKMNIRLKLVFLISALLVSLFNLNEAITTQSNTTDTDNTTGKIKIHIQI